MHAALQVPLFRLRAAAGRQPDAPLGLIDPEGGGPPGEQAKAPLLEVSPAAERAGVRCGMTGTQALVWCPALAFLPRDAAAESRLQQALLRHAQTLSADVEDTGPGRVVVDLSHARWAGSFHAGTLPAEGGPPWEAWQQWEGGTLQLGIASLPDLAVLAAELAGPPSWRCIIPAAAGGARHFIAGLPVQGLAALVPTAEDAPRVFSLLAMWGIRTLGQLADLPRGDLVRRLGPTAGTLWDLAAGRRRRLLRLHRPSVDWGEGCDLEPPLETLPPLLATAEGLMARLMARLSAAWLVTEALRLDLKMEDGSSHHQELRLAEPSGDLALLGRVLRTHLETVRAAAPINGVRLEVLPVRPGRQQRHLFEQGLRDPHQLTQTLSQLEALLGKGRVGRPLLHPTRHPAGWEVRPYLQETGSPVAQPPPQDAPLRRFRPSRPVQVTLQAGRPTRLHSPALSGAVLGCEGPFRLSGDWWEAERAWGWEEWDVELESGCYRLHQAGGRWQVVGVYG